MNITKKKTNIGSFVIYIFLFLFLLFLNGALNFVVAKFDLSIFTNPTYWLKTITGSTSGLIAFILFSFMRRDALVMNDLDFNKEINEVNVIIKSSIGPDFPEFIASKNLKSKIARWKEIQENKLLKWNTSIPGRVLNNIQRIKEDSKWSKRKGLAQHRARKWIRKRDKLQERLTQDWINKNIYYQKIKYPFTTVGEIINGERNNNTDRIIDNRAFLHIMRDRLPMIALTMFLQAAYHSLAISEAKSVIGVLLGIIFQLITIFMNVATGLSYGATLFKKLDLNNLTTRKQYIMEYLIQSKGNK